MRRSFFYFIILIFTSISQASQTHILFWGGGGELEKSKKGILPFEAQIQAAAKSVKEHPAFQVQLSYGEPSSEDNSKSIESSRLKNLFGYSLISKDSGSCCVPFTETSLDHQIQEYIQKIQSGEISSKDQLMLVIQSHGAYPKEGDPDHQILYAGSTLREFDRHVESPKFSIQKLKNLQAIAKDQKIPLAIMDMSCFSGLSLELLKDDHSCLISAAAPDDFAYNHEDAFSVNIWKAMKNSENLEEAFLKARSKNLDPAFPMIGTSAGESFQMNLRKILTPYLRYNDSSEKINSLRNYLFTKSKKDAFCELSNAADSLRAWGKNLNQQLLRDQIDQLIQKVEAYKKFQMSLFDRYEKAFQSKYYVENKKTIFNICVSLDKTKNNQDCFNYTLEQLMSGDFEEAIKLAQKIDSSSTLTEKNQIPSEDLVKIYQQAQKKKERLLNESEDLRKIQQIYQGMSFEDEKKSYEYAKEISALSAQVYQGLYQKKPSSVSGESNACKKFLLPRGKSHGDDFWSLQTDSL